MMIENYKAPSSIAEAAQLLHQGEATIVAGGTDLTPQTEAGAREFAATLINIQRIEEMRGISLANGRYRIGGLTTVTEILESETLAADVPVLVEAADHFASPQIRNASTLAGNLCNASPAGDMCIPLLLLDAEVELASWANDAVSIRTVALSEFFCRARENSPCKRVNCSQPLNSISPLPVLQPPFKNPGRAPHWKSPPFRWALPVSWKVECCRVFAWPLVRLHPYHCGRWQPKPRWKASYSTRM